MSGRFLLLAALLLSFACSPSAVPGSADGAAPALSGKTLDGKTVSLADYEGKVVLVDFWATWCGPCKTEIPELIKLQDELGPKGFVVLGVSMDEDTGIVPKFAKAAKINYPVILLGGETAPKGWTVPGLPTAYLIGRDGTAVLRLFGSKSVAKLKAEVEAALAR
jgi:thiol-disulfide isomerase/thioredoxin